MASNYQRKVNNKPLEKFIIIAVEGETEEKYFKEIRNELHNQNIRLEILSPIENASHPKNRLADLLSKLKGYDSFWLVCDVDRHHNLPAVIKQAKNQKIQPIISNPCFEVWLYLYFGELEIIGDTVHFDATQIINQGELNSQKMKEIYKKSKVNHNNNHQIAIKKAQELTKNDDVKTFLIEQKHRGKSHVYKLVQEILENKNTIQH
jgi:hypothetical protein